MEIPRDDLESCAERSEGQVQGLDIGIPVELFESAYPDVPVLDHFHETRAGYETRYPDAERA